MIDYLKGEYTDGVIFTALRDTVLRMEKDLSSDWYIYDLANYLHQRWSLSPH